MKDWLAIPFILVLGFLLSTLTGIWWMTALVAWFAGLLLGRRFISIFLAGLLGGGLLWFLAAFIPSMANEHLLAERLNTLLDLPVSALLLTAAIGAVIGALGAGAGYSLKTVFPRRG